MIIGEVLVAPADGNTVTYYSPWFHRGGNAATFVCDLINTSDEDTSMLEIQVQTKNSEDGDAAAINIGSAAVVGPSPGEYTFTAGESLSGAGQGFLEMLRYQYTLTIEQPDVGFSWVQFRMLESAWLSNE